MTVFLIEPRDPLIARDGRPAGFGGSLTTLPFPTSSTVAGAARTRMASIEGAFTLPDSELGPLLEIEVHGPILAELQDEGGPVQDWLLPAPRDAVLYTAGESGTASKARLHRLEPAPLPPGCAVDDAEAQGLLVPAFVSEPDCRKPLGRPPAFWRWTDLAGWLGGPSERGKSTPADGAQVDLSTFGLAQLPVERRAHLAIEPGERVGVEGYLYQTAGLRFLSKGSSRFAPHRLALSLRSAGGRIGERDLRLRQEVAPLGGDRRLARWRPCANSWPAIPKAILESIVSTRRARLVLLTSAAFVRGALPGWNGSTIPGTQTVKVHVRSACVGRAEVISGWDLRADNGDGKARGRAKPTRRLAPAGSVYFVELKDGGDKELRDWCEAVWWQSVSDVWIGRNGQDDAQARRDGFGLCALGTWAESNRKEPS